MTIASLLLAPSLTLALAGPGSGPEPVAPVADAAYSQAVNRSARGLGFGIDQGIYGGAFGQRLHLDVPFGRRVGQFFGLRVQGTVAYNVRGAFDPVAMGGLELFGRSPVMGGIVRVYGGGGVFVGGRFAPGVEGRRFGIAGGGHMGIEAFAMPRMSFSVEIGGQAPVHALGLDAGASVLGGINFYFGR